jgi:hypothetical protein
MQKLLIVTICLLTIISCRKDIAPEPCTDPRNPTCDNYNPCIDAQPTSADFTIEEIVDGDDAGYLGQELRYPTDTGCTNNPIVFTCKQKADSTWWIFDDVEMRPEWQQKRSFTQKFFNPFNPFDIQRVKITCVVKRNKPNPCFPDDNGMDTVSKMFTNVHPFQAGFRGKFLGTLKHKPDSSFVVDIYLDSVKYASNPYYAIRYDGLLQCAPMTAQESGTFRDPEYFGSYHSWGYYGFYLTFTATDPKQFPIDKGCKNLRGFALVSDKGKRIQIEYYRNNYNYSPILAWPPQDQTIYQFSGERIP